MKGLKRVVAEFHIDHTALQGVLHRTAHLGHRGTPHGVILGVVVGLVELRTKVTDT